jgi:nucleotide-binding universal stress UspA family protein
MQQGRYHQRRLRSSLKKGVEHSSIIRHGDPGVEIVKAAEENKADLIVVGSRGLSTLRRLILGSVSRKVINKSKIPVLVVK